MQSSFRLIQLFSALALVTLAGLLLAARPAAAAVPDAPWSGTGTATTTVSSDGSATDPKLEYAVSGFDGSWSFSAKSKSDRVQPVDWKYAGFHSWFQVRVSIERFVIRSGKEIVKETLASGGPAVCCTPPSGGFSYTGSTKFDLKKDDVYGFRMTGSHFDSAARLEGTLVVTTRDVTPPTITPVVTGKQGKNGFYTSDVDLAWKVEDPDSRVTALVGCANAKVTADTSGAAYNCTASTAGGKASQSVTIKRDATAPELTVPRTILKEGAGPVDYAATATDTVDKSPSVACSSPSGTQFPLGVTTVNCTATDAAGNTAAKDFDVLVVRGAEPQATKRISPVLAFRATVRHRVTRLEHLVVRRLPAGSTATVACKGGSCPKQLRHKAVTRRVNTAISLSGSGPVLSNVNITKLVKGQLKAGTQITVAVWASDGESVTKTLTIRRGKAPQVS